MRALRFGSSTRTVVVGLCFSLVTLAAVTPVAGGAANPKLVKDIVVGGDSNPLELTAVGTTLFFTAAGAGGRELWKSDGSEIGTVRVKNIRPGATGSDPAGLTNMGGILYFSADDGAHGQELWRSDGTSGGTTMVADINGTGGSNPASLLAFGEYLYFSADDGIKGVELWRSNGTAPGTTRVKDLRAGSKGSNPGELTAVGNRFYFVTSFTGISKLWKSDGTGPGTVMIEKIGDSASGLTKVGTKLFFIGPGFPGKLWKSDGTAAGTKQVDSVTCGWEGCHLTGVAGIAYVSAFSDDGIELVRTNGTGAGTYVVKDINAGEGNSSWPDGLIDVGGTLMFFAITEAGGQELWRSNGTEGGTEWVASISPINTPNSPMAAIGSTLYLEARQNPNSDYGLWSSDGTNLGTQLVMAFVGVGELTDVGGTLFFWAHDGVSNHGRELWKYVP